MKHGYTQTIFTLFITIQTISVTTTQVFHLKRIFFHSTLLIRYFVRTEQDISAPRPLNTIATLSSIPFPVVTFSGIGDFKAPACIRKSSISSVAWAVGSSGCKHHKSSINFCTSLGIYCQANKHILAWKQ